MSLQKVAISKIDAVKDLPKGFKILDVGGAAAPCARADYIMDYVPFEKMSKNQVWGGDQIKCTKDTYIVHDICDRQPFPFPDKFFDFVVCSHVLEDIRDPIWVCSEISRVGKAGYIETPSRLYETSYGIEAKDSAGAVHHRWILDLDGSKLRFTMKYSWVHLPWLAGHTPPQGEDRFLKVLWDGDFEFFENYQHGGIDVLDYLTGKKNSKEDFMRFQARLRGYPSWLYMLYRRYALKFKFLHMFSKQFGFLKKK